MFEKSIKSSWFGLKKTEMVKRTIYISACECGETDHKDHQLRERLCSCGRWVPYTEQSAESREYRSI